MNTAHVWRAALERLRRELSRAQFDTWLRGTQLVLTDDGACELRVRTTFAKDMLETRYRDRIEAAIAEVAGAPCVLRIAVLAGENDSDGDESPSPRRGASRRGHGAADAGGYDRPALFTSPDESPPTDPNSPASAAPRRPGESLPRQALPPSSGASRNGRIRARLASSNMTSRQRAYTMTTGPTEPPRLTRAKRRMAAPPRRPHLSHDRVLPMLQALQRSRTPPLRGGRACSFQHRV